MLRRIVFEAESLDDSQTMFRLLVDDSLIARGLTAVQAHILVGEILERISLPMPVRESKRSPAARV